MYIRPQVLAHMITSPGNTTDYVIIPGPLPQDTWRSLTGMLLTLPGLERLQTTSMHTKATAGSGCRTAC